MRYFLNILCLYGLMDRPYNENRNDSAGDRMNQSRAIIIVENREALRVAASAARISTQQGTAMEMFESSMGDERDLKLIGKVLSSGHKSVIEHQTFSIAFNDVSVFAEQFAIESRLASFTVKSRRYVDFVGAGFVMPEGLNEAQRALYAQTMNRRFADYERLMALGVPKEDARFLLPYCLRSNFYMTLNARELIVLVCAMLYGRGKGFPEIEALGRQLPTAADYFRCACRSLAFAYRDAVRELEQNTGRRYDRLYIVGGGAKNTFLNELTERTTGKQVVALPIEATALGNLKVQMEADK